MPIAWRVGPSNPVPDLAKTLEDKGLTQGAELTGMAADLAALNEEAAVPQGFTLSEVDDGDSLASRWHQPAISAISGAGSEQFPVEDKPGRGGHHSGCGGVGEDECLVITDGHWPEVKASAPPPAGPVPPAARFAAWSSVSCLRRWPWWTLWVRATVQGCVAPVAISPPGG